MAWGSAPDHRPGEAGDGYPDYLWPDEDDEQDEAAAGPAGRPEAMRTGLAPDAPVPYRWDVPPPPAFAGGARWPRRSILTLALTAVLAVGLGAGGVALYRDARAGSGPAAPASQGDGLQPGQGGGPAGQGTVTELGLIGKVTAVGPGTITFGAGPMESVKAAVTSATKFTGSVRTLSGVRVGDTVAAQITIVNGVARVASLQDPASES
jgi:hypothetical protein